MEENKKIQDTESSNSEYSDEYESSDSTHTDTDTDTDKVPDDYESSDEDENSDNEHTNDDELIKKINDNLKKWYFPCNDIDEYNEQFNLYYHDF